MGGEGRFTLEIRMVALGSSLNSAVRDWLFDSDWHADRKGTVLVFYTKSRNLVLTENTGMPSVYIWPPRQCQHQLKLSPVSCGMPLTTSLTKGSHRRVILTLEDEHMSQSSSFSWYYFKPLPLWP